MKKINLIIISSLILFLSACGGSSSSGGGSLSYDGNYTGTLQTPFFSDVLGRTITASMLIGILIESNVVTRLTLGDLSNEFPELSIPLNGNSFSFSFSGGDMPVVLMDGVTCIGLMSLFSGTVVGDTISGELDSSSECTTTGQTTVSDTTGTYTATRN